MFSYTRGLHPARIPYPDSYIAHLETSIVQLLVVLHFSQRPCLV